MMELLEATPLAAQVLAMDVREVDKREWELGTGRPFLETLLEGLKIEGSWNRALWDGGECLALFGVHPLPGRRYSAVGQAWFVGTNSIMRRPHETHRFWDDCIGEMHQRFPTLMAYAWSGNWMHHRWMRRMGFVQARGFIKLSGETFLIFKRQR